MSHRKAYQCRTPCSFFPPRQFRQLSESSQYRTTCVQVEQAPAKCHSHRRQRGSPFRFGTCFGNQRRVNGNVLTMKSVCFSCLFFFDNLCSSQLFFFVTDDGHNNEGMHCDVNVMYMLIKFLCIIFRSLFIFLIMSRGLSPSQAQADPRPWKRLRLQFRQA